MNDAVADAIQTRRNDLVALRRELHAMPELGFKETSTAALIGQRLSAAGLQVRNGIGGTGLTATLDGSSDGPTLMIRADIDGLPIDERTGLGYASTNGAMHACGHDGHVTMAVGAAEILAGMRDRLKGRVVFLFQPAEEVVQGALAMIEDGVLDEIKPDRVIGLHLWNQVPLGQVGVNQGTVFAGADAIRIEVTGKGGHGALPHTTVDPVVTASAIVTTMQTVVSREISPNEMGVVTFGKVHGGSAPNVIADQVVLEGTIRAYRPDIREKILEAVPRIAAGVASGMRARTTFKRLYGAPPVINNPEVATWVARHATAVVGESAVGEVPPVSVGDDMAEFLDRVPGCYFLLGAAKEGSESHHNAGFDFDERCLPTGTEIFVRSAVDYLG
ncbi:MAG: M20 family metallopeptidase [Dehalococcoidia bacterium]